MKLKNTFYSHSLHFFVGILTSRIETKERREGSRGKISTSWVRSKESLFLFEVVWGVRLSWQLMSDVLGGPCPRLLLPLTLTDLKRHKLVIYALYVKKALILTPISCFCFIWLSCEFVVKFGNLARSKMRFRCVFRWDEALGGLNLNGEFKKHINKKPDRIVQEVVDIE